jgi:hypothetical protein
MGKYGPGSIGSMTPANEPSEIERQWDGRTGTKPAEGPAENAALPGRRCAQRIDSKNPGNPPGGEGNGANDKPVPHTPQDVNG